MTVSELLKQLQDKPPEAEIICWLPGSTISLGPVMSFLKDGKVLVEGNVDPGSALEALL